MTLAPPHTWRRRRIPRRRPRSTRPLPPPRRTRLGKVEPGSIAPAVVGLVELGMLKRPELAREVSGRVELRTHERHPPVSVTFGESEVIVEDAADRVVTDPDLIVEGALTDLLELTLTPLVRGLPDLRDARGRTAVATIAGGRVRFHGRLSLVRQLMGLLQI